jgi:hypothetical protein
VVSGHRLWNIKGHAIREFVDKLKAEGLSFALNFTLSRYPNEIWPFSLIKMVRGRREGEAEFPDDEHVTAFIEAHLERDRLQEIFVNMAWSLRRNFQLADLPFGIQDRCNLDLGDKAAVTQLHDSLKEFPSPFSPAATYISSTSSALMEFSTSWLQNRQSIAEEGDLRGKRGESNSTTGTHNVQPAQPAVAEDAPLPVLLSAPDLTSPAIELGDATIACLESFDERQWAITEIELKKIALHLWQEGNLTCLTANKLTTSVGRSRAESQESYNATALEFYRKHAIRKGTQPMWLNKADLPTFQTYLACAMSLLKRIEIQFHHHRKQKTFLKEMKALAPARQDIAQGNAKPTTHSTVYSTEMHENTSRWRSVRLGRHQELPVPDPKALKVMSLELHRENSLTVDDNQTVTSDQTSSADEVMIDSAIIFGDHVDNSKIEAHSSTPNDDQIVMSDGTSPTEEVVGVAATHSGDHIENSSIEATSELSGVD